MSTPTSSRAARAPSLAIVSVAGLAAAFLFAERRTLQAQKPAPDENSESSEADEKPKIKARLKCMRQRAGGIRPWVLTDGERVTLKGRKEPLFRLVDPTRNFPDGTLWAWPEKGRPATLVTLSLMASWEPPQWLYEFASLSDSPIGAEFGGAVDWSAQRPGWEPMTFNDAPAPADSESERLRQMRSLARRFNAVELLPPPMRFELRLLPQPVVRYADLEAGQLDGAVFLLCHGTNPEILLTIEARQDCAKTPVWQYGFARNSSAELQVKLDGADVWMQPHIAFAEAHSGSPYYIAVEPVRDDEMQAFQP